MGSPSTQRGLGRAARLLLAATTLLALAVGSAGAADPAAAGGVPRSVPTVVVVLSPFLTWDDVTSGSAPTLHALASAGAVANMNAITADPGWPTAAGGALTLSAGRWSAGPLGAPADPAHLSAIASANAGSLNPPLLGALAQAVRDAGGRTAAVGNGDEETSTPAGTRRPAALMAMGASGTVDLDLTSAGLRPDPSAPFGAIADAAQLHSLVRIALADKPSLLVIDPGDLERAHDDTHAPNPRYAAEHTAAVRALDALVADVVRATDPRHTLLLIVTPATDKPYYEPPYFGPVIASGMDLHGELTSASTQRPGLIANIDIGPTVLSALAVQVPGPMAGQPARADGAGTSKPIDARIAELAELGRFVGAVDYTRDLLFLKPFADATIWLVVIASILALVPLLGLVRPLGRMALLFALSVPSGAWLLFAIDRHPLTPEQVLSAFIWASVGVFVLVGVVSAILRRRAEVPLLALSTLTALLICADQWTGHPLESGLFSYSIRAGWRYYGMGNEGAALLVGASIIAVGLTCDLAQGSRWARPLRLGLMPVVGLAAVATAAAPFAGANAGVAVWGVVAYGVAWARVNRLRVTWGTVGAIVLAVVVLVAAFAAVDMARHGGQTHIGRFFAEVARGDLPAVQTLVVRKALNNYDYLPQTPYTWLALALLLALATQFWLPGRPLARALAKRPGTSAALIGVLVGGVVGALTEDSGIVMPALMLYAGALPALHLALLENPALESLDPDVT